MAGFTRSFRGTLIKFVANQTPGSPPTTIYAGFSTANPGDDVSAIAEPTIGTGGYARQLMSFSAYSAPAAGATTFVANSATVTWGPSSAAWSTGATPLTHIVYWTASTGVTEATSVAYGAISLPSQVSAAGISITAQPGALQLQLAPS